MKNPEEIKKGLEYLSIKDIVRKLDMWKEGIAYDYAEDAAADALAYIQQLEAENERLQRYYEAEADRAADSHHNMLEAEASVSRWISVKDRLPEEGELVVFIPTINQGSIYVGKLSHTGARGGVLFENRQGRTTMKYYAKYWMPLPEPPEVTKP